MSTSAASTLNTQVILRALQDYGMILADTGDRLNISGSPDSALER